MTDKFKDRLKKIKAFERENRLALGHRSTATKTIKSRKEKEKDARKQRKSKSWKKDLND